MGLFDKLFGSDTPSEKKALPWQKLSTLGQLNDIADASHERPQVIFKHSTRCGISRSVINRFEHDYDLDDSVDLYYLDLLSFRDISNEIASRFQVWHESPQLLVIKDGHVVHHASHGGIQSESIKTHL